MITPVSFIDSKLNPVSENNKIAVSSFTFTLKHGTTEPAQMILNVCINKEVAGTDSPEFPVYIPAGNVYHTAQHQAILSRLRSGQPFCMISPVELQVFRNDIRGTIYYFGNANNFIVI